MVECEITTLRYITLKLRFKAGCCGNQDFKVGSVMRFLRQGTPNYVLRQGAVVTRILKWAV